VLITASVASTNPGPYYATYAASKAFDLSFAEAIRYELKDSGVTVTALLPGPTDTDFFRRGGLEDTRVGRSDKDDPADVAREGFEALMAGKDHVVAGSAKNKLQVISGNAMPMTAQAAMHARQVKPGSGND
jgi:short-subunit dehydrogenase